MNSYTQNKVAQKQVIVFILSACATFTMMLGLYFIYINTYSKDIAYTAGSGWHYLQFIKYFIEAGVGLILVGALLIVAPFRLKYILLIIISIVIIISIYIFEVNIKEYSSWAKNKRVFPHRFMNAVPPMANHDGHWVKDKSDQELEKTITLFEKEASKVVDKFNKANKKGKKGLEELLVPKYFEPGK